MDTADRDNKNKNPAFIKSNESNKLSPPPSLKKPKSLSEILSKNKIDDTESFDDSEHKNPIPNESNYNPPGTTHSILDLIQRSNEQVDQLTETDKDIKIGDDITSRIEGKSLDELLKECEKEQEKWEEPKPVQKKKITTDRGKYKHLKIIMMSAIILIVFSALVVNFMMINKKKEAEKSATVPAHSIESIKIPSYLKDPKQLQPYYEQAEKLYKKKRYKDALHIFSQLLKTGWNKGVIYGMMGNCKLQMQDYTAAKKYYTLSIKEGYKATPEFASHLADSLKKDKNYPEIISILAPFAENFSSNQKLQMLLAESYQQTGNAEKTIECYKKLNPGNLSEQQLKDFAKNLELTGDREYAFKIYLLLGRLYGNTDAYIKAEKMAPDQATKISILSKIVDQTASTPDGNFYKLKLAIALINSGNQEEGIGLLKSLETMNLTKEEAKEYIKLAPYLDKDPILTRDLITVLNKYYPYDMDMHQNIMTLIQNAGKAMFCREFFRQEFLLYPENPLANYFYAINSKRAMHKQTLLVKAIKLAPKFFEAKLALAKSYIDDQNWREAYKLLEECIKQKQFSREAQFYFTITRINLSSTARPLKEYEGFLKQLGLPEDEILKEMILMSEHMRDKKYPLIYLKQAEKKSKLKEFCEKEEIKIKLIYRLLKKTDFTSLDNPEILKYYIIYLISIGEARTVMNMPDDNNPDIEFWKLFIRWKRSLPSWKQKSYKLLDLKQDDYLISSILKLWLKKITLPEAEARLTSIPMIDRPLFTGIIAEQYRKEQRTAQSNFFYRKAIKYPNPNIYVKFLLQMRKN